MSLSYNRIAGQNIERLAALSDGIFSVGMTLLVLDLSYLERGHRSLAWVHLGFLFAVTLMPFSTRLLGEFPTYRIALIARSCASSARTGASGLLWRCN